MVTQFVTGQDRSTTQDRAMVDPRAPRFGQAITASGLLAGVLLDMPVFIFGIAVVLVAAVASQWRVDVYGLLFKRFVKPVLEPRRPESATPHRFAKVVGAVGSSLASAAILAGFPLVGYGVAILIVIPAALGATTGFCLGCHMYQQVNLFQRLSIV